MKQQEQMMREMEQVVSRRDTIVTRGEAQAKIDHKTPTKGAFQKKLNELKKKIAQTKKVEPESTFCCNFRLIYNAKILIDHKK